MVWALARCRIKKVSKYAFGSLSVCVCRVKSLEALQNSSFCFHQQSHHREIKRNWFSGKCTHTHTTKLRWYDWAHEQFLPFSILFSSHLVKLGPNSQKDVVSDLFRLFLPVSKAFRWCASCDNLYSEVVPPGACSGVFLHQGQDTCCLFVVPELTKEWTMVWLYLMNFAISVLIFFQPNEGPTLRALWPSYWELTDAALEIHFLSAYKRRNNSHLAAEQLSSAH